MAHFIRHSQMEDALRQARRSLEAQVQEQIAELHTLKLAIENTTDIIFLTRPDGTITYVNPAFEETYGYRREEAIGQMPRILKSGQTPPEEYRKMWQTLLSGQPFSAILPAAKKPRRNAKPCWRKAASTPANLPFCKTSPPPPTPPAPCWNVYPPSPSSCAPSCR
ncbi:MAG: PAS domain-containing protein [Caldilineae bacterium]|nr:MAG: PAS domain-containing protein [Caldilineae bacterium]